jgi:two-component system sensor histidine kinase ChvG
MTRLQPERRWLRGLNWRPSRIGPRLLAFNLLVVFVPVVGVLYLDVYEARLLQGQEREMVQQARLLAAVLGDGPQIDVGLIERAFQRLERQTEARLRVFDAQGRVLADSRSVPPPAGDSTAQSKYSDVSQSTGTAGIRRRTLYRLGAWIESGREWIASRVRSRLRQEGEPVPPPPGSPETEVQQALQGRYGAATRQTPGQRSLTMVSALPVRHEGTMIGAVVVSQSTFRILQALYEVRLRIFEVVLLSLIAAAALTTIAATTIVRPLKRLRRQATALAERSVPLGTAFPATERRDEIGALARALEQLTKRLDGHIGRLESFAADMAHEFRNPLAAIRAAADTIAESSSVAERSRFLEMMRRDVDRLDRLVAGAREIAHIDGALEQQPFDTVDVGALLDEVIERVRLTSPRGASVSVRREGSSCLVRGASERLAQLFENLLSNALGFAPDGTAVDVTSTVTDAVCRVTIADRGPGIPEAHLARVFDRFFSYRPGEARRDHLGLGLAIAKQIVESHGGAIAARNREGGGAVFDVELVRTRSSSTSRS